MDSASDLDRRCATIDDAGAGIAVQAVGLVATQVVDLVSSASDMDSRCATTDDAGAGIAVQAVGSVAAQVVDSGSSRHVAITFGAFGTASEGANVDADLLDVHDERTYYTASTTWIRHSIDLLDVSSLCAASTTVVVGVDVLAQN